MFESTFMKAACTHTLARHAGVPHASLCELASSKRVASTVPEKTE